MYCYKPVQANILYVVLLAAALQSCKPDLKNAGSSGGYFDIKGYFTADIARLDKLHPSVLKTVSHNGVTESKKVMIDNWGRELDLFISADINKPAWKNSYTVTDDADFLIYKAKEPELKMREILVRRDNGKVKWILIFNKTRNILYQTTEKLTYYPDSLYIIEKDQRVKLMGNNHYKIEGVISGR